MRKVTMLNRISLDGFYAGPNGEIDWFIHEADVDRAAHEMMNPDTLLMGRLTYQMFESYWPPIAKDPKAPEGARMIANELNEMTKVVFSKSLEEVAWVNSKLVKGDIIKEVSQLKQGNGADITIFGSGTIVQQLAAEGLVDEYLVVVTPVILGAGKPLFKEVKKCNLELLETRSFPSGNLLLHYRADKL
jgi:dihydrofolate reductase